ncbi:hypothetical protein [Nocardia fluminea]|uniref:hypothetical protein n=1 Tax=Nocardia fluminea TaxID=134984 RepID=UPI003659F9B4
MPETPTGPNRSSEGIDGARRLDGWLVALALSVLRDNFLQCSRNGGPQRVVPRAEPVFGSVSVGSVEGDLTYSEVVGFPPVAGEDVAVQVRPQVAKDLVIDAQKFRVRSTACVFDRFTEQHHVVHERDALARGSSVSWSASPSWMSTQYPGRCCVLPMTAHPLRSRPITVGLVPCRAASIGSSR